MPRSLVSGLLNYHLSMIKHPSHFRWHQSWHTVACDVHNCRCRCNCDAERCTRTRDCKLDLPNDESLVLDGRDWVALKKDLWWIAFFWMLSVYSHQYDVSEWPAVQKTFIGIALSNRFRCVLLRHPIIKQAIRKRKFESLFPFACSPDLRLWQIEAAVAKSVVVFFVCPSRLTCALHML